MKTEMVILDAAYEKGRANRVIEVMNARQGDLD